MVSRSTTKEAILQDFESGSNIVSLKPGWAVAACKKATNNKIIYITFIIKQLEYGVID